MVHCNDALKTKIYFLVKDYYYWLRRMKMIFLIFNMRRDKQKFRQHVKFVTIQPIDCEFLSLSLDYQLFRQFKHKFHLHPSPDQVWRQGHCTSEQMTVFLHMFLLHADMFLCERFSSLFFDLVFLYFLHILNWSFRHINLW